MVPGLGSKSARIWARASTTSHIVRAVLCPLDSDQDVHAIAQRASQAIDGWCALHRPPLDDQRRDRVDLIRADESGHTLDRQLLARHRQPHPWVRLPAACLLGKTEGEQVNHA